jgi:Ca2+-binding EF-hand superfamily protein
MEAVCSGDWCWKPQYARISKHALDFMKRCMTEESKRFSAAEALNHPWLQHSREVKVSSNSKLQFASTILAFSNESLLVQLLMEVISFTLKSSQIKHIRQIFLQMDTNATAEVSREQYEAYLKDYMSADDIKSTFKAMDYNNSSIITYHKFLAGAIGPFHIDESNMALAFDILTRGREDFFTFFDLIELFGDDVDQKDLKSTFADVGLTVDTKVTLTKFKSILHRAQTDTQEFSSLRSDMSTGEETIVDDYGPVRVDFNNHEDSDYTFSECRG